MNANVDKWLDAHMDELITALQSNIRIPSVKGEPLDGAPFGAEVKRALVDALTAAKRLGFETTDLDGYAGLVDYGAGEELLGVLAHLDVVPEGTGWTHPAYGGEIHDGVMYGRGVLDDKGPAFFALYALAAIKACGLPMKRRVRIILGCDEESGMACMAHYVKHAEIPAIAFSPDADYPLVNSEKSSFRAEIRKLYPSAITLSAGERANVVPGEAVATAPLAISSVEPAINAFLGDTAGFSCEAEAAGPDATRITMTGLSAHASMPELGKNAMLALFDLLSRLPLADDDAAAVAGLRALLGYDFHGEALGLDRADASGRLTLNPGVIRWDENGLQSLKLDLRVPLSFDPDELYGLISSAFQSAGFELVSHAYKKGHFVPEDSELVTKLLDVYEARTGERLPPLSIGGGTYARAMPMAVAFGCERPGRSSPVHMPNEFISLEDIAFNARMMADAIIALACA